MKKDNAIQISIIVLSSLVLLAATYFAFQYSAAQVASTNILQATDFNEEVEQIAVPINYETRISKGNSLANAGYHALAASEYAFAINIQPENPEAYEKLGETYLALNKNEKAKEQFERAIEISPENPTYKAKYAISLMRIGDFEEAKNVLSAATVNQEVLFYSGVAETITENYEEAKTKFSAALATEGSIEATLIQNFSNAFLDYDSQKEGQSIYLQALIAKALVEAKEFALAESLSKKILDQQNDYRDVWILLGYSQLKTENYTGAEDAFKQAKHIDPVKPETHYFLANAHYFQEEYENAVTEFELALLYDFEPSSECYRKIAESNLILEKYEEALEAYEYLLQIENSSINDYVQPVWIAITYLNDLERAFSLAQEGANYYPEAAMSYNLLGWVQVEKNQLSEAEKAIDTALKIDPNLAAAHYNQGLLREKQNKTEDAKNAFMQAYELGNGSSIGTMAAEKYNSLITQEINQASQ